MARPFMLQGAAVAKVTNLYLVDRMPGHQIAELMGLDPKTIYRLLKRLGLTRTPGEGKRQYQYDQHFFARIDTHEKAQVLGLWYADGGITSGRQKLAAITLADHDLGYLEHVRRTLRHEAPLLFLDRREPHHHDYYRLTLHGAQVWTDLNRLGCVPRKSLILRFPTPEQVPTHLLPSFMLGYFEGDGCVTLGHYSKVSPTTIGGDLNIVGTREFCEEYGKVLCAQCGVNYRISKPDLSTTSNTYRLTVSGNTQILKVADFLYSGCQFRMQRKWEKLEALRSALKAADEARAQARESFKEKAYSKPVRGLFKTLHLKSRDSGCIYLVQGVRRFAKAVGIASQTLALIRKGVPNHTPWTLVNPNDPILSAPDLVLDTTYA